MLRRAVLVAVVCVAAVRVQGLRLAAVPSDSIVDEPPPAHALPAWLSLSVGLKRPGSISYNTSGRVDVPHSIDLMYEPRGNVEFDVLCALVLTSLHTAGLQGADVELVRGGNDDLVLTPVQWRAVQSWLGEAASISSAFQQLVSVARQQISNETVTFGSADHLQLQFSRLGLVPGVPLVSLAAEDTVAGLLKRSGEWEPSQTALLQQFLSPGDVAVDVGAHIGTHAVAMSHSVYPDGVVHAFEAQAVVYEVLSTNAALSGTGNMLLHHAAVGNPAHGDLTLSIPRLDVANATKRLTASASNFGGMSLLGCSVTAGGAPSNTLATETGMDVTHGDLAWCTPDAADPAAPAARFDTVPLLSLDSFQWYLSPKTCPKVIKIDVERMELEVLHGANETLRVCKPAIHVENNGEAGSPALIALLTSFGYRLWWEIAPFFEQDTYFGLIILSSVEAMEVGRSPPFSPNLLAVHSSQPFDGLPAGVQAALRGMTAVEPDKPFLANYTDGVHVVERLRPVVEVREQPPSPGNPALNSSSETGATLFVRRPIHDFNVLLQQVA